MSYWTQVCGVIRVDCHAVDFTGKIKALAILYNIIGPIYRDNNNHKDECKLPIGSEGSVEYMISVTHIHDACSHLFNVGFSGSLRDFKNEHNQIDRWFKGLIQEINSTDLLSVRDSALMVTH